MLTALQKFDRDTLWSFYESDPRPGTDSFGATRKFGTFRLQRVANLVNFLNRKSEMIEATMRMGRSFGSIGIAGYIQDKDVGATKCESACNFDPFAGVIGVQF